MIKDTVAPIPIEELKEYFNDDSIVFNINYANSTLKGNKLLTYISNLDIPVQLSGFYELSYEEKEEFVLAYMNSKLIALVVQNLKLQTFLSPKNTANQIQIGYVDVYATRCFFIAGI